MSLALLACGGREQVEASAASSAETGDGVAVPTQPRWQDDRLEINIPVDVLTIGFGRDEVAALQAELVRYRVDQAYTDLNQALPPDTVELQEQGPTALVPVTGEIHPMPIVPTAVFTVRAATDDMVGAFSQLLAKHQLTDGHYDAQAIEDWLADRLDLHPGAPALVLLHLDRLNIGEHGWRVQGHAGYRAPVRVFGEREPLLILDPSAEADPYVASGEAFTQPVAADDTQVIADFVRQAMEFRLLHGTLYEISQAPCHAVTAIVGTRALTNLSERLSRPLAEALSAERIKASFDQLTATDVYFDLKILELPQDDPVLDAITRGEYPAFELLRGYLSQNFEQYHVGHEGCQAYLSVISQNDIASVPGWTVFTGYAGYDDMPGHRISGSWINDLHRLLLDVESPLCISGCGDNQDYYNVWEYLLSHETGHLFGQRHPHDVSRSSGNAVFSDAFSSIWSSMSYQNQGRWVAFGAVDQNNWLRNRAAFALHQAAEQGRQGEPQWQAALAAAGRLDWRGVWSALQP